jgi:hypothetical protein
MKIVLQALGVIAALGLGWLPQAQADNLTVSISNGIVTQTCQDGAACDTNSLVGVVTFATDFALFPVDVTVGSTASASPATAPYDIDMSYNLTALSIAPGRTYTIMVSENNLSGSNLAWSAAVGGTQNNGATTAYALFADANNSLFGTGTSLCSIAATASNPFASTCASGAFGDSSFSLTQRISILTKAGFTSASGDALAQAPEPGTLLLFGSAMAGLGVLRRRRARTAE